MRSRCASPASTRTAAAIATASITSAGGSTRPPRSGSGRDTLIQLGYEHFQDDRVADRGVPSQFRPAGFTGAVAPLDTRRGEFFGDPDHSPTFTDTDAANLYVSHDFGGGVTLRNRTRYADYDKFYQNIFPGLVNATTMTNPAGPARRQLCAGHDRPDPGL